MKTGFKDPIASKDGKKQRSPWNFDAPQYDQRSSCFVSAGTDYGTGHKNPIGHESDATSKASTLPYGRVNTLSLYPNSSKANIVKDENF